MSPKVAIVVPGRFHLFNLAQQLLKRGYLSQLITSYPKSETKKWGIPADKVNSILIKEILFRGWQELPKILRGIYDPQFLIHQIFDYLSCSLLKRADLVVGGSSAFLKTLKRARSNGAVTIVEHGSTHIEYQRDILLEEYDRFGIKPESGQIPHPRIVEKELEEYKETDYISIPSSFVKRTFLDKGIPEDKLLCIPYGVDLSRFQQVSRGDNVFRIVFAGTICLRKGVQYLLKAFSELNLPDSELVFMGTVSEDIKGILKQYGGGCLVKHIPHFELYKHYSQGSVFVLPSIEEGLARVLFEAMACGLPVIATPNTGAEDIIENGKQGFIVPIRDVEALKEKILYLYEHQDIAKQMGQLAKQKVSTGYTWDDYGDRVISVYEKIIQ